MACVLQLVARLCGSGSLGGHLSHRLIVLLRHASHGLLCCLSTAFQSPDVSIEGLDRLLQRPPVSLVLFQLQEQLS